MCELPDAPPVDVSVQSLELVNLFFGLNDAERGELLRIVKDFIAGLVVKD